jgi:hypothetical protein
MLHDQVSPDPDVEQAINDFLPTAAEIRDRSARLLKLAPGSDQRRSESQFIRQQMNDIGTRAARLGLSADALMVLLNDALDAKARRGRAAPVRPSPRSLMSNLLNAEAALQAAQLERQAAEAKVKACAAAVAAAQSAYSAYAGGRLVTAEAA